MDIDMNTVDLAMYEGDVEREADDTIVCIFHQ